jgi:hypothetical protein
VAARLVNRDMNDLGFRAGEAVIDGQVGDGVATLMHTQPHGRAGLSRIDESPRLPAHLIARWVLCLPLQPNVHMQKRDSTIMRLDIVEDAFFSAGTLA